MTEHYANWLQDHLRIVVPMAGLGSRFGTMVGPKPMIRVLGQSILDRTLTSLPFFKDFPRHRIWFAVNAAHVQSHHIDDWLRSQYGNDINVFVQTTPLKGNLDTAEQVASVIHDADPQADDDPILFLDSDNAYDGSFVELSLLHPTYDDFANVYYFTPQSADPHWCFVAVASDGRVTYVAEKTPLPCGGHPIIGVFYFRRLGTFLHAATYILTNSIKTKDEFYMSQVYELLVNVGVTPVYGYEVPAVTPLGTPHDVEQFITTSQHQPLRLCFDLDGTLCETKQPGQDYADVRPLPGAVDALRRWKADGHTIILYTARNMVTRNSNLGAITAKQVPVITTWLDQHGIPYDELVIGKPHADIFVDDAAYRHVTWTDTRAVVDALIARGGRFA